VALLLGTVKSEDKVYMDYRQHANNYWGGAVDRVHIMKERIKSIPKHLGNHERSEMAMELLKGYGEKMQAQDRLSLERLTSNYLGDRVKLAFSNYYDRDNLFDTVCIKALIVMGWI
jgi:hypothetical protein